MYLTNAEKDLLIKVLKDYRKEEQSRGCSDYTISNTEDSLSVWKEIITSAPWYDPSEMRVETESEDPELSCTTTEILDFLIRKLDTIQE